MKRFSPNISMENPALQKQDMQIYCIRLIPSSGYSNFKRNPRFAEIFTIVFSRIVSLCEKSDCAHILQHSNHIIIAFNVTENSKTKNNNAFIHDFVVALNIIILQINKELEHRSFPFTVKAFLAADQGNILMERKFIKHPLCNSCLWLGETIERATALSDIAGTGKYPPLLITHTIFAQLDAKFKNSFNKNYYYRHMCCYGCSSF